MNPEESQRLNNELLKSPEAPSDEEKRPKRNSKDELTGKILKVVEAYELEFNYSDTKLRRMNKQELTELLAAVTEQGVKHDMAKAVGVEAHLHTANERDHPEKQQEKQERQQEKKRRPARPGSSLVGCGHECVWLTGPARPPRAWSSFCQAPRPA